MNELENTLNICDIWRLGNPENKRSTFWQNHRTGFIVDWAFFLIQMFCKSLLTNLMSSFCSDHGSIFLP